MPGDDGVRPDDDEVLAPPREPAKNENPEGSVPRSQGKLAWLRPEEDAKLMAEGEVLSDEDRPGAEKGAEGPEREPKQEEHRARIRSEADDEPVRGGPAKCRQMKHLQTAGSPGWDFGEAQRPWGG